jgi:ABC-type phosphate transport system substrate-binding protein
MLTVRLILFICCLSLGISLAYANQSVIANPIVPDKTLSHKEIVNIFTRKKTFWSDGRRIVVYTRLVDSIEHRLFIINVLNLSPFRYKAVINDVIFNGLNTPTIELATDAEMLMKISATPYSIGYTSTSIIVNNNSEIIKIKYD